MRADSTRRPRQTRRARRVEGGVRRVSVSSFPSLVVISLFSREKLRAEFAACDSFREAGRSYPQLFPLARRGRNVRLRCPQDASRVREHEDFLIFFRPVAGNLPSAAKTPFEVSGSVGVGVTAVSDDLKARAVGELKRGLPAAPDRQGRAQVGDGDVKE